MTHTKEATSPIELPAYTIAEGAHHLRLPLSTVKAWALGRPYETAAGTRRFQAVISAAAPRRTASLSFHNLVELHVLSAIRRDPRVRLRAVRRAIEFVREALCVERPLADQQMSTDGKDLFVECYGGLINASRAGQYAMKEAFESCLERIARDPAGLAIGLWPFSGRAEAKVIFIDPRVRFGRPCVAGTGIATDIIVDRFSAGDTIEQIASDYGRPPRDIEEAIRFETAT